MILDQFRVWARETSAAGRAQGLRFIIEAYLLDDLGDHQADAVQLLTEYLDDPSPLVRKAMAEGLAHSAYAPRHLVTSLADDQPDVASIILEHSPILRDAELIDLAALAEPTAQVAIASRSPISEPVAAALAEVACLSAAMALLHNRSVRLPTFSLRRLVERHGQDGELRECLLKREDLPPSIRLDLVAAATQALGGFVVNQRWLSVERMAKIAVEQRDRATIAVAAPPAVDQKSRRDLVAFLRRSGQLTTSLTLRAVLSGNLDLVAAVFGELADLPMARTAGLVRHSRSAGFAALYRRTGLPSPLLPVFCLAIDAGKHVLPGTSELSLPAVQQVLAGCDKLKGDALGSVIALLRRFEAEAAREVARAAIKPLSTKAETADIGWHRREQGVKAIEIALSRDFEIRNAMLAANCDQATDSSEDNCIRNDAEIVGVLPPEPDFNEPAAELGGLIDAVPLRPAPDITAVSSLVTLRAPAKRTTAYDVDLAALEIELLAA